MSESRKWITWLFVDGALWAAAVAGLVFGIEWAGNLFKFLTILATLMSIFVALAVTILVALKDDAMEELPKHPARKLARGTDAALMLLVAAYGWFFYAVLVLIQILCSFWVGAAMTEHEGQAAREPVGDGADS